MLPRPSDPTRYVPPVTGAAVTPPRTSITPPVIFPCPSNVTVPAVSVKALPFLPPTENTYEPNRLWFEIWIVTDALPGVALLSGDVAVISAPPPGGGKNGAV